MNNQFWQGKKVFLTGHTGFKGAWLSLWLVSLGARVTGYALKPPTEPNLFDLCQIDQTITSIISDIRNLPALQQAMTQNQPDIIIHLAAQPLVGDSYNDPLGTYTTNVIGTANLLETSRWIKSVKTIVNVTSDKCYENKEKLQGYKEEEPLGGYDPYSSSKACSELVTVSFRNSFFNVKQYVTHGVGLASARAGNVIGGGDWANYRLVPDFVRAVLRNKKIIIKNPKATRPWQHVLEPLSGYLVLAQKLYENGGEYSQAWNFGPEASEAKSVEFVVRTLCDKWGQSAIYEVEHAQHPHESNYLQLDITKAKTKLGWQPKWSLERALEKIVEWTKVYQNGEDVRAACLAQIREYEEDLNNAGS